MLKLNIRVKEDWMAQVKLYAKKEGLTVSAFVRLAVNEYIRKRG